MLGGILLKVRESIPENPLADVNEIREWLFIGGGMYMQIYSCFGEGCPKKAKSVSDKNPKGSMGRSEESMHVLNIRTIKIT